MGLTSLEAASETAAPAGDCGLACRGKTTKLCKLKSVQMHAGWCRLASMMVHRMTCNFVAVLSTHERLVCHPHHCVM